MLNAKERADEYVRQIRMRIFNAAELLSTPAPPRQWLVQPWIPDREVTLLSGDGGVGKSIAVLQLCAAKVAARQWFGLNVRSGPALYISCEDDIDEVHYRLEQLKASDPGLDLTCLHVVSLAGEDATLASPDNKQIIRPTPLFIELEETVRLYEIELLVLDAAADVFGGDEISRAQTRGFIAMLRGLALRHDCAVVLLSHPSVAGMKPGGTGYSGSTAWNNSVRSRIWMTRPTTSDGEDAVDNDLRSLELVKSNRGRAGEKLMVRWNAGIFAIDGTGDDDVERLVRQRKTDHAFLLLLDTYAAQGRQVSPNRSAAYAPVVFAKTATGAAIGKKALELSMNRLLADGTLKILTTSRKQYIARANL